MFLKIIPVCAILLCIIEVQGNEVTYVTLNVGTKMPTLGLGTALAFDKEVENAIDVALEAGYRHIDTATVYQNEEAIGRALNRWISSGKVNRSELFIVTKLPPYALRPENVEDLLKQSLKKLQLDYVDLYLIHHPFGLKYPTGNFSFSSAELDPTTDHVAVWKKLEEQVDKGLTKAIGVSNFNISQITKILDNSRIKPSNLQIECHLYLQQNELVDFCKKNDIAVTAYSPLGSPGLDRNPAFVKIKVPEILNNPVVIKIAEKHKKSPAQVLLRFTIQRGLIAIPKSTNPKRIKENIDIFDFALDEEDVKALSELNKDTRIIDFTHNKNVKSHPEYPF